MWLTIAVVNAVILVLIAVVFVVMHLRGATSPRESDGGKQRGMMIALTIAFLISAGVGVLTFMLERSG